MTPTRSRTAASPRWQLVRFNISQLTLDAVKPFGLGNKEALRCKNMWTLGLALWMFDRDRAADRRLAQRQVRQEARARRGQYRRAERRPRLWRDGRDRRAGPPAPHRRGARRARPLPHRHRRRIAVARAWSPGAQLAGLPMFFGGYPITPASADPPPPVAPQGIWHHHLPGGGRDRRDLRRDRRQLCRPAGRHLLVGPGHRAQGRGDRPRGDDRAAAGDRQFAARRAVDRPADQDRAVATSTRRSMAATATRRCR